eukprot:c23962_g1_i1 orf=407-1849(-)
MNDFDAPTFSLGLEDAQPCSPVGNGIPHLDFVSGKEFFNGGEGDRQERVDARVCFAEDNAIATQDCGVNALVDCDLAAEDGFKTLKPLRRGTVSLHPDCSSEKVKDAGIEADQVKNLGKNIALQSFWKSLNQNKENEADGGLQFHPNSFEDDEIEDFSSEDERNVKQFCSQSSRKTSLCGKASAITRLSFKQPRAASAPFNSIETHMQTPSAGGWRSTRHSDLNQKEHFEELRKDERSEGQFGNVPAKISVATQLDNSARYVVGNWDRMKFSNDLAVPRNRSGSRTNAESSSTILLADKSVGQSRSSSSDYRLCQTVDPKVNSLLRYRLPHFTPVNALMREGESTERVFIDYVNQFGVGGESASTFSYSQDFRRQHGYSSCKKVGARGQKLKEGSTKNGGWIQSGSRCPTVRLVPGNMYKASRGGGNGHWLTEKSGKRIYITEDGRELRGSTAYKQHLKDSGKYLKRRKKRRSTKKTKGN